MSLQVWSVHGQNKFESVFNLVCADNFSDQSFSGVTP